ncbi:MAG: T9SS type A sorting domain-containing protein [bacterium]|nr:T9SS type A sorting domain-containing protein [bacterium]
MLRITALVILSLMAITASAEIVEPQHLFICGSSSWTDPYGNEFSIEQNYAFNDAGYVEGAAIAPQNLATTGPWSTEWTQLHIRQRLGLSAYRFDLPAGDYLVRLFWMEGGQHGPRLRVMDVSLEGQLAFDDLDLCEVAGFQVAYEVSRLVHVSDGTLDVEFDSINSYTILSAIGVWSVVDDGLTPAIPSSVSVQSGYGVNCISWDPSPDFELQDAVIYSSNSASGPFEELAVVPYNQVSFMDREASTDQETFYRVSATNIWGREGFQARGLSARARSVAESGMTIFNLDVAAADLDSLNAHPLWDVYYPATWAPDLYPPEEVEVHYRGGLARRFRKKSWKIELDGGLEYNGTQDLLLVANPDDPYLIRNQLSHKIFDSVSTWNADVSFVHLEFNGEFWGVYDLAEKIGEDFVVARGAQDIGSMYKCYNDMRYMYSEASYRANYDKKTGAGDSFADLMEFADLLNNSEDCDFGPWIGGCFNFEHFFDYYSMMIYTRQYDFIQRNYYLYFDRDIGLWTIFPWDMTLSFHHSDMPLDFGTSNSPHFWGGTWNRLIDRILTQPRLRWAYITRLEELHATVLNEDYIGSLPYDLFAEIEEDGSRDFFKFNYHDNSAFSSGGSLQAYRILERDQQFTTMIPEFKQDLPQVCINEHLNSPTGDSWLELFNYGDRNVDLGELELTNGGSDWSLPTTLLAPGGTRVLYLDGDTGSGPDHSNLVPAAEGGVWTLQDHEGTLWDTVRYGAVEGDLSQGRQPDGWVTWNLMTPTQGSGNDTLLEPVIVSAHLSPEIPESSDDISIQVQAYDPNARQLDVHFHYTFNGSPVDSVILAAGGGNTWEGVLSARGEPGQVNWWITATNDLALAVHDPVGSPYYHHELLIRNDSESIYINEFMADNETTIVDEQGVFEDWVEIYNGGEEPIDLAGYTLTDDLAVPDMWTFVSDPACVVPAGGFLLIWTDDDDEDGVLHTNFKLSRSGESIGLYSPEGDVVDYLTFTAQSPDTSLGRLPNGGPDWMEMPEPTPGAGNIVTALSDNPPPLTLSLSAWPNPFNPKVNLSFSNPATGRVLLEVFDVNGRLIRTLVDRRLPPGTHETDWSGFDDAGRTCATGLYFVRLVNGGERRVEKVLLLK